VSDSSPVRRPRLLRWRRRGDDPADEAWSDAESPIEAIPTGEYENGRYRVGQYETRQYGSAEHEPPPYAPPEYEPGQYDSDVYSGGAYDNGPYGRPADRAYSPRYPVEAERPTERRGPVERYPSDPMDLFAPANASAGRYAPAPDPYPYSVDEAFESADPPSADRRTGPILGTVFVLLVVALVGAGGWWIATGPVGAPASRARSTGVGISPGTAKAPTTGPIRTSPAETEEPPAVTALVSQANISAEQTSPDGRDSAGAAISYRVDNVADGSPVTTWRMNGDGTGRSILFSFDQQVTVTELAMTNGYTKQDRRSGADRYLEERRITRVTWTSDDGTRFEQSLTDPERKPQRMQIPVTRTSSLTLTIDRTTPPGDPDRDYTAISEVEIGGAFS
jgi:hypothetical protein